MSERPIAAEMVLEAVAEIKAGITKLHSGGPLDYWLKRVDDYSHLLFSRFCPFAIGDRVKLMFTPNIDKENSPGWHGSRHFLVEGSTAIVVSRDADRLRFTFGLKFDDDSWIDNHTGEKTPRALSERGVYTFREEDLDLVR